MRTQRHPSLTGRRHRVARSRRAGLADRDRGSVLTICLVLIVIASLVILPLLSYSATVFRANQVVAENTAEAEAARAGLRVALADPTETYRICGSTSDVTLPGPGLDITTMTTCALLDVAGSSEYDEMYGVASAWYGESPLANIGVAGIVFDQPLATESDWISFSAARRPSELEPRVVWTPQLPVHALAARSAAPYALPPEYPLPGVSSCDVYFPGTYADPVVLSGPTYFASGVYYFESEVRVVGNTEPGGDATVVVTGHGDVAGCINDTAAWFSVIDPPVVHNITGKGATFVLGAESRLVVDDTDGPVTLLMNHRYVESPDADASAAPSIMTVNGRWDSETATFDDLISPTELHVPRSMVDAPSGTATAIEHGYVPSTLTPVRRAPTEPQNLIAAPRSGGAVFTWDPPVDDGGEPVTAYVVDILDELGDPTGSSCTTSETTGCTVSGLTNDVTYGAAVAASNTFGTSDATSVVPFVPGGEAFTTPGLPTDIGVAEAPETPVAKQSVYLDAFEVSWAEPADVGAATIDAYEVEVTNGTDVFTCATAGTTSCVVSGVSGGSVTPTDTFTISVRAENVLGWGAWEATDGFRLDELGEAYVPPEPVDPGRYVPLPVIEIASGSASSVDVRVPGYIAVPQGVVKISVTDPVGNVVKLTGGVLAAWFDIADPLAETFTIGIDAAPTQRRIRILTQVVGSSARSEAVVQINASGAWAVNSWSVS